MIMRTINLSLSLVLVLVFVGCLKDTNLSPYFPCGLIDSAVLYELDEEEYFPSIQCGVVSPSVIIDSTVLSIDEWEELITIASKEESPELYVIDCFQASFAVVFRSKNKKNVSHLSASLNCRQLKYADDGRLHFMTKPHRDELRIWRNEVVDKKTSEH